MHKVTVQHLHGMVNETEKGRDALDELCRRATLLSRSERDNANTIL